MSEDEQERLDFVDDTNDSSAASPTSDLFEQFSSELVGELSQELFGGGAVPGDLAALWVAQEADDTDLLDSFELILMRGLGADDALAPLESDRESDLQALAALRRLLGQVIFVAEAMDGLLLGYWRPEGSDSPEGSDRAVVVGVDDHGQISVLARTFAEALISLTDHDDPAEAGEVVAELRALGIEPAATTVPMILDRVSSVAEPNEVVLGYLLDERLNRS